MSILADGTLTYCLSFPAAMQPLLEMARFLALDIFTQFKLQCVIKSFDYYTRVEIAVVAPIAFASVVVLVCVLLACRHQGQRRRQAITCGTRGMARARRCTPTGWCRVYVVSRRRWG